MSSSSPERLKKHVTNPKQALLDKYIPFGCLVLDDVPAQSEWKTWSTVPPSVLPTLLRQLRDCLPKLLDARWIAIQAGRSTQNVILRVHVLPIDVEHYEQVDRGSSRLDAALHTLIQLLDTSPQTWQAQYSTGSVPRRFDQWATQTQENKSLFYLFNQLPSPAPDPNKLKEKYAREALEDLLNPQSSVLGLKTRLYPYQRRSAGLMLQREATTTYHLDPRLEQRIAADGSTFYYPPRSFPLQFYRYPTHYQACRGGILAESMGLGKTCILLALILATKHQSAKLPVDSLPTRRHQVGTLSQMAVTAIQRHSLPWQVEFQRIEHATGVSHSGCRSKLDAEPCSYLQPQVPRRRNRSIIQPPPKTMYLSATSLIVVPQNLLQQWALEFQKHVEKGALKVLVIEQLHEPLPAAEKLCAYDVILFTRNRFEIEDRDGSSRDGRRFFTTQRECQCPYIRATRTRDCHCLRPEDLYHSPLRSVHFKRLIVDEGHFFSSKDSRAAQVANNILTVDHRWVVSGTPAKDLTGVEVELVNEIADEKPADLPSTSSVDTHEKHDKILTQRGHFDPRGDVTGAIKSIGSLATHFLKVQPWNATGEQRVDWADHIYRHQDMKKRTYHGYSICLERTLASLVVKTRAADVEIELPPLYTKTVRLEPSFYDKLTANLFTLVLTANAVTSERTDADYLFHKNNGKARNQLVSNLRQSAAIWTGFGEAEVEACIKVSKGYLEKENASCSPTDRQLLEELLHYAERCLANDGWKGLSRTHELGVFVEDWPAESAEHWSFSPQRPLLIGVSHLLEAQRHVNERADQGDPAEGLAGAGIRALAGHAPPDETTTVLKGSIPSSSLDGEPDKRPKKASPRKLPRELTLDTVRHPRKRRISELESAVLPENSPLRKTQIVGTSSAKVSYLISQILGLHQEEKILVFFDGENVAYYLAQLLELLNIQHEIYAKTLHAKTKSDYVVRFNESPEIRVLLTDVKQAAFGLNICAASRVFFINPVCQPSVEAQAIKRAHRIGQTRPVFVETLVLKGSLEERMLQRSQVMTRNEHQGARSLADDGGMRAIIQSAAAIAISPEEDSDYGQMAPIAMPQQLFGRVNWQDVLQWGPRKAEFEKAAKKRRKSSTVEGLVSGVEQGQSSADESHVIDLTDANVLARFSRNVLEYDEQITSSASDGQSSPTASSARRTVQFVCTPREDGERSRRSATPDDAGEDNGAAARKVLRFAD